MTLLFALSFVYIDSSLVIVSYELASVICIVISIWYSNLYILELYLLFPRSLSLSTHLYLKSENQLIFHFSIFASRSRRRYLHAYLNVKWKYVHLPLIILQTVFLLFLLWFLLAFAYEFSYFISIGISFLCLTFSCPRFCIFQRPHINSRTAAHKSTNGRSIKIPAVHAQRWVGRWAWLTYIYIAATIKCEYTKGPHIDAINKNTLNFVCQKRKTSCND